MMSLIYRFFFPVVAGVIRGRTGLVCEVTLTARYRGLPSTEAGRCLQVTGPGRYGASKATYRRGKTHGGLDFYPLFFFTGVVVLLHREER